VCWRLAGVWGSTLLKRASAKHVQWRSSHAEPMGDLLRTLGRLDCGPAGWTRSTSCELLVQVRGGRFGPWRSRV
jgi:hypothetical protein